MAAGGGMVYWKQALRLWDAKKAYHKGIFGDSKVILNLNEYKSFIFVTRVTQLIHDAGKYLLISVYPLPTHPTHNFTHKNGGNLDTLNSWLTPTHINSRNSGTVQWKWRTFVCITKTLAQKVWCTIANNFS